MTALISILVAVLTRKLRAVVRDGLRFVWIALLVTGGVASIVMARRVLGRNPEVNPFVPGGIRLAAIEMFGEAFAFSSLLWMPRVFDALERGGAGLLIAVRQLRARKSGFLTVISFLAFLGVGLSSFGLCLTISIMGGFGNDLKRKILGNNAHVVIDNDRAGISDWRALVARIAHVPGVQSASALVQGEVMVTSQTNLSGVILRGIDPHDGSSQGQVGRELVRGRLGYLDHPDQLLQLSAFERRPITGREGDDAQAPVQPPQSVGLPPLQVEPSMTPVIGADSTGVDVLPGIVVGRELASNLHLTVGDEVRVVSPFGGMVTPAGALPKTRLFRVAGVFYSGMYEYDTKYAYVTIPVAQNFFNYDGDRITSIEVRVPSTEVDDADAVARAMLPIVGSQHLRVRDWKQLNQNLFRALKLEKLMMFVLLGVAIMVASFAIVATLLLLVMEKGREIAVLKAMGATDGFIARVFMLVGLLIGFVGSGLGVITALLVCTLIQKLGIPLDPEVYYIDRLPVFVSLSDYAMVLGIALGVCLVATLYPAWAAARLRPVEGMRFG